MTTMLASPSGFYVVVRLDLWDRFLLDPLGAEPSLVDCRGSRQLRDADFIDERTARNRIVFKRIVAPPAFQAMSAFSHM